MDDELLQQEKNDTDDGFTFMDIKDSDLSDRKTRNTETPVKSLNHKKSKLPKKRKKAFSLKYFLLFTLGTLVLLSLVIIALYSMMLHSGKKRLQENVIIYNPPQLTETTELPAESSTTWKSGWVKHNSGIYEYNEDILTFLVMGIDSKTKVTQAKNSLLGGQSDALLLVVMDTGAKTIRLVNINRNTMSEIEVYNAQGEFLNTATAQINLQHGYGDGMELSCERTVSAVSNLFYGIPIHGYVSVNYVAIPQINDLAGGVTVTVLDDLSKFDPALTKGATVKLNGNQAFRYVQYRDTKVFDSVSIRMERIKQYLVALINTLVSQTRKDLTIPAKFYDAIKPYMVTNISLDEVVYLATEALSYDIDTDVIALKGETKMGLKFEEFYADEEALYDLVIDLFYKSVNQN